LDSLWVGVNDHKAREVVVSEGFQK
jgi:hypothetical protein